VSTASRAEVRAQTYIDRLGPLPVVRDGRPLMHEGELRVFPRLDATVTAEASSAVAAQAGRMARWAYGYRALMIGGLGERAHVANVGIVADEQAPPGDEFPWITAEDVESMLARLAAVEALRNVYRLSEHYCDLDPDADCVRCVVDDLDRALGLILPEDTPTDGQGPDGAAS